MGVDGWKMNCSAVALRRKPARQTNKLNKMRKSDDNIRKPQ